MTTKPSKEYRDQVGKLLVINQKYENKDYKHLVLINKIVQEKKNDIYYYSCSMVQTNIEFNGVYPFAAQGQYPLNVDISDGHSFKIKERLANINFRCRDVAPSMHHYQWFSNFHHYASQRDADLNFIKEYEKSLAESWHNTYIDHETWMKYNILKNRVMQSMVNNISFHAQNIVTHTQPTA